MAKKKSTFPFSEPDAPPYNDPFEEDIFRTPTDIELANLPSAPIATQTTQSGMPAAPDPRQYSYLTGEQFFADPYAETAGQWWDPFTQGGQYGMEDLASMYAGIPVVSGYYDEGGTFVPEQSLYNQASSLRELRNVDIPAFEDWLKENYPEAGFQPDLTKTPEYQGIAGIAEQLTSPGQTEADIGAAEAQAALMQGFMNEDGTPDVAGYRAAQQEYRTQLDRGVMGQEGIYGTEYEQASRRAHALEVQNLIDSNQQMIEAIGIRSTSAAYSKLAEVSNQIANTNAQYELKMAEQDLLMRQIEYEAMNNRLAQMQAQGLAVQEQYLNQLQANRYEALQAYAQNLTAVIETNKAYFQMYGQDLEAMKLHADTVYQTIMADIGIDQAAMERANQAYEAYMAPYLDALDAWYMQQNVLLAQEGEGANWGAGITGALSGAAVGTMILPGIGTVIGGLLGFLGGLFG